MLDARATTHWPHACSNLKFLRFEGALIQLSAMAAAQQDIERKTAYKIRMEFMMTLNKRIAALEIRNHSNGGIVLVCSRDGESEAVAKTRHCRDYGVPEHDSVFIFLSADDAVL